MFGATSRCCKVVSHTPIECEKLTSVQKAGDWVDAMRMLIPEPTKLYTWWSYRSPDWADRRQGPPARPYLDVAGVGRPRRRITVAKNYRGAERPSDHVPVTATLEV